MQVTELQYNLLLIELSYVTSETTLDTHVGVKREGLSDD